MTDGQRSHPQPLTARLAGFWSDFQNPDFRPRTGPPAWSRPLHRQRACKIFIFAGSARELVDLAARLPVHVEVVDTAERIERILPEVYDMVSSGLVEVQDTQVMKSVGQPEQEGPTQEERMRLVGQAKMLSIHIGADDRWEGEPLHEAIVKRARALDIAGATAYRGVLGYGAHKRLHKHRALALSQDDPLLITVIDTEEKVNLLLGALDSMIGGGCLIAISDVTVVRYEKHAARKPDDPVPG